jgi:DNA-binding MarR family transcriptional regulator
MEKNGYITRTPLTEDKRKFAVHPTEKLLEIIPEIRRNAGEWRAQLAYGISDTELETFYSVLERMEARAKEIIEGQD